MKRDEMRFGKEIFELWEFSGLQGSNMVQEL